MAKNFPAPHKCIDAVEAGVQNGFDKGLAFERECFLALVQTPESQCAAPRVLRRARGEQDSRRAGRHAACARSSRSAVIGAGTMGGGIAMNFVNAGMPVTLLETKQDALDRGLATIRKNYEAQVKKGKLTAEKLERAHGADHADARLRRPRATPTSSSKPCSRNSA